jgi:phage/plasmid-like protein (TIGR03299 family)
MTDYFDRGFSVREPMWHQKGVVLGDYPGRDEAMMIAGHNWKIEELPVFTAEEQMEPVRAEGWKALLRSDTRTVLHVARDSYTVVQNAVLWDIADAMVGMPNVEYETAGLLKSGRIAWVLARLDEPVQIDGDSSPTYPFVLSTTTHDGSGALRAAAVSVRVVCWNTWSAAGEQAKDTGLVYTFRHVGDVSSRFDEARDAIRGVRAQHEAFIELANELAALPVDSKGRETFVQRFIPYPKVDVSVSDRVVGNIERAREQVRAIIAEPTVQGAGIGENAYGLLEAGIEYLDYNRRALSEETRFGRSILRRERFKDQLVGIAKEAAGV